MEILPFITWFGVVAIALGVGMGSMLWAYKGKGTPKILFTDAVLMSPQLRKTNVASTFHQGYDAFQAGNYPESLMAFSDVIREVPDSAEALHNRGLVLANLGKDNESVQDLVQAAEVYAARNNGTAIAIIRQQIEVIKQRDE
ncbi:MAG: hypothetical protein WBA57_23955 [Elainellaceae cyanobacterium]